MTKKQSHIPNTPLRKDIIAEVKKYIGYAYADDIHPDDYLTIDKDTLAVSHTRRSYGEPRENHLEYYDMSSLITRGSSAFTYAPDELEIDAVVLDFFPIDVLNKFPTLAESAILDYLSSHTLSDEVTLGFPVDTFEPSVYVPSELEYEDSTEEEVDIEALLDFVAYISVPVKNFVRIRNGKIRVNRHRLLLLALEHYYKA